MTRSSTSHPIQSIARVEIIRRAAKPKGTKRHERTSIPVSYTHLTLPTNREV